jgi:hypothetical protein
MKYDIGGINKRSKDSKKRKLDNTELEIFHVPHYTQIKKFYSHLSEDQIPFVSNCIKQFDSISILGIKELQLNQYWTLSNIEKIHANYKEPMLLSSMMSKVSSTSQLEDLLKIIDLVQFTDNYWKNALCVRFDENNEVMCNQEKSIVNILFHTYYTNKIDEKVFKKLEKILEKHNLKIDLEYATYAINICVEQLKHSNNFDSFFTMLLKYAKSTKNITDYTLNMIQQVDNMKYELSGHISNGIYTIFKVLDKHKINISDKFSTANPVKYDKMIHLFVICHYKLKNMVNLFFSKIKTDQYTENYPTKAFNSKLKSRLDYVLKLGICNVSQVLLCISNFITDHCKECVNENKMRNYDDISTNIGILETVFFDYVTSFPETVMEYKENMHKVLEILMCKLIVSPENICKTKSQSVVCQISKYKDLNTLFSKHGYLTYLDDLKNIRENIRANVLTNPTVLHKVYSELLKETKYKVLCEEWIKDPDFM